MHCCQSFARVVFFIDTFLWDDSEYHLLWMIIRIIYAIPNPGMNWFYEMDSMLWEALGIHNSYAFKMLESFRICMMYCDTSHEDIMPWKCFLHYYFMMTDHLSLVDSPLIKPLMGALMDSFLLSWKKKKCWTSSPISGYLRCWCDSTLISNGEAIEFVAWYLSCVPC